MSDQSRRQFAELLLFGKPFSNEGFLLRSKRHGGVRKHLERSEYIEFPRSISCLES